MNRFYTLTCLGITILMAPLCNISATQINENYRLDSDIQAFKEHLLQQNETQEEFYNPPAILSSDHTEDIESQINSESDSKRNRNSPQGNVRVILTPLSRTILSSQISTPILSSQVSAPVTKIYKRMGETFKKGDSLIEIDRTVFFANLKKSKAILIRSNTVLDARQKLYNDSISSLTELKEAQAAVETAKAELALAINQYDWALIKAPYDGRVITVFVEEFELPQPGQALVEIMEDQKIIAKALVPAVHLSQLSIGKIFKVYVQEINKTVDATIIRIGAVIDPSSETISIDAEIDNSDHLLLPGMTGSIQLR